MIRTTFRPLLAASVAALMLSAGAMAQTTAPAPSAPAAPAARTQAQTTLAPNEVTSTRVVGAAIYAPKAAGQATQNRAGAPATTGSTTTLPTVSDADWTTMKGNHDHIGEVNNLVLSTDGRIQHVVLGVGGFLGIGEKSVSVRFSDIRWMTDSSGKIFGVVQRTRQELEAAPAFVDRT